MNMGSSGKNLENHIAYRKGTKKGLLKSDRKRVSLQAEIEANSRDRRYCVSYRQNWGRMNLHQYIIRLY